MHDIQGHELISRYCAGVASRAEARRLDGLLLNDASARRLFLELANLEFGLETAAADRAVDVRDGAASSGGGLLFRGTAAFVGLGFVAVFACLSLLPAPTPAGAIVGRFVNAGPGAVAMEGQPVVAGKRYELAGGTVTLATTDGVAVSIDAPAAFSFESAGVLRLERGRTVADVPDAAHGFTVVTPSGKAIDLGTRFGVAVDPTGAMEMHVFQGTVIAENVRGQRRTLRDGDAVAVALTPPPAGFVRCDFRAEAVFRDRAIAGLAAGTAAAPTPPQSLVARLRQDAAWIAGFDFDADEEPRGVYGLVPGRMPGTQAAEFARPGDHLAVDFGDFPERRQLTFVAWVWLDAVGGGFQSLFHTDTWSDRAGSIHWIVTPDAAMRFAIRNAQIAPAETRSTGESDSSPCLAGRTGRWVHLAVVYDADAKTVRFFVDGALDRESRLAVAPAAVLGRGRIGNWSAEERVLLGRVDDIVVLGRAVSDDEIRALHAADTRPR